MDTHPFLTSEKLAYIDDFLTTHLKFVHDNMAHEPELPKHEDSIEPKFQSLINDTRELLEVDDDATPTRAPNPSAPSYARTPQQPTHRQHPTDITSRPKFHAPPRRASRKQDVPEAIREPCHLLKGGTKKLALKRITIPRFKVPNQLGIYNKGKRSSTIQVSKYSQPGKMAR